MSELHDRPTVAFDARMVNHSGIGTHIRGLVGGLAAQGEGTPRFTFLGEPGRLRKYPQFGALGEVLPWNAPIYSFQEQVSSPFVAGADIWHFPHYNVPWRFRPRRPCAVTVHDLIHLLFPEVAGSRAKWLAGRILMMHAVRRAGAILTVSECSRRDLARTFRIPEERIVITPNAVDPAFMPVGEQGVDALREELGLSQRYLLAVGIHKPHKNLSFLIRTFLEWRKQSDAGREVTLVLCGQGEAASRELGHLAAGLASGDTGIPAAVRFLPWIDHTRLPALYQGADALVFPSLYEGFGLPVLEAQRVGTPVIASSAASIPEAAGEGALYFDPRSSRELSARLDELYTGGKDLTERLIAAGYANEQRFSWKHTADRVLQVYERLAGHSE